MNNENMKSTLFNSLSSTLPLTSFDRLQIFSSQSSSSNNNNNSSNVNLWDSEFMLSSPLPNNDNEEDDYEDNNIAEEPFEVRLNFRTLYENFPFSFSSLVMCNNKTSKFFIIFDRRSDSFIVEISPLIFNYQNEKKNDVMNNNMKNVTIFDVKKIRDIETNERDLAMGLKVLKNNNKSENVKFKFVNGHDFKYVSKLLDYLVNKGKGKEGDCRFPLPLPINSELFVESKKKGREMLFSMDEKKKGEGKSGGGFSFASLFNYFANLKTYKDFLFNVGNFSGIGFENDDEDEKMYGGLCDIHSNNMNEENEVPKSNEIKEDDSYFQNWGFDMAIRWLNNILFQETVGGEVVTMEKYLKSCEVYKYLYNYFDGYDGSKLKDLRREIKLYERNFEEKEEDEVEGIYKVLRINRVRTILERNLNFLIDECDGFMKPNFMRVLLKRVFGTGIMTQRKESGGNIQIVKKGNKSSFNLVNLFDDMRYKYRHWWDVEFLFTRVMFHLIFSKDFDVWLKYLERRFVLFFKKEKFEFEDEKVKEMNRDYIKYLEEKIKRFQKLLTRFNKSIGVENGFIEHLSYEIKLKVDFHISRIRKCKNLKEVFEGFIGLDQKEEKLKRKLDNSKKLIELETRKIVAISRKFAVAKMKGSDNLDSYKSKIKRISESKKAMIKERIKIEKDLAKIDVERKDKCKRIEQDMKDISKDNQSVNKEKFRLDFEVQRKRKLVLYKLIEKKINSLNMNHHQLKIKLVLSLRKMESNPKRLSGVIEGPGRAFLKLVDGVMNPNWFRFGLFHSSILVKNLSFNWFSNSLVFIKGLKDIETDQHYEDVICVDTFCPIIGNTFYIYEKILKLCRTVIFWNTDMKYSEFSFNMLNMMQKNEKNCQEFVLDLLKDLEFTPHYTVVRKYLDKLKTIVLNLTEKELMKTENIKDFINKNLRFLELSPSFIQKFSSLFDKNSTKEHFKLSGKKDNILFLTSHGMLDQFVIECTKIEPNFKILYPGTYSLLKGFDRAFFLMKLKSQNRKDKGFNGDGNENNIANNSTNNNDNNLNDFDTTVYNEYDHKCPFSHDDVWTYQITNYMKENEENEENEKE